MIFWLMLGIYFLLLMLGIPVIGVWWGIRSSILSFWRVRPHSITRRRRECPPVRNPWKCPNLMSLKKPRTKSVRYSITISKNKVFQKWTGSNLAEWTGKNSIEKIGLRMRGDIIGKLVMMTIRNKRNRSSMILFLRSKIKNDRNDYLFLYKSLYWSQIFIKSNHMKFELCKI